jgi:stalled ribosome rescue protein Dom34
MKRKLIINEPAKKIIFKERVLRTPVHISVTDAEFKLLEVQMRAQGIVDYQLVDSSEMEKPVTPEVDLEEEMKIAKKSKPSKPKEEMTILERLASE